MASRTDRAGAPGARLALLGLVFLSAGCSAFATKPGLPPAPPGRGALDWPVDGQVTSAFGPRGKTHHDGIDIAMPVGSPVRASAAGTVIFSGSLRGYGNTVILDHHGGLTTVYAHHRENLVSTGDAVRRGQVIGRVGESGRTTGPNLHFEVRRNKVARDPIAFLPDRRPVVAQREARPVKRNGTGG